MNSLPSLALGELVLNKDYVDDARLATFQIPNTTVVKVSVDSTAQHVYSDIRKHIATNSANHKAWILKRSRTSSSQGILQINTNGGADGDADGDEEKITTFITPALREPTDPSVPGFKPVNIICQPLQTHHVEFRCLLLKGEFVAYTVSCASGEKVAEAYILPAFDAMSHLVPKDTTHLDEDITLDNVAVLGMNRFAIITALAAHYRSWCINVLHLKNKCSEIWNAMPKETRDDYLRVDLFQISSQSSDLYLNELEPFSSGKFMWGVERRSDIINKFRDCCIDKQMISFDLTHNLSMNYVSLDKVILDQIRRPHPIRISNSSSYPPDWQFLTPTIRLLFDDKYRTVANSFAHVEFALNSLTSTFVSHFGLGYIRRMILTGTYTQKFTRLTNVLKMAMYSSDWFWTNNTTLFTTHLEICNNELVQICSQLTETVKAKAEVEVLLSIPLLLHPRMDSLCKNFPKLQEHRTRVKTKWLSENQQSCLPFEDKQYELQTIWTHIFNNAKYYDKKYNGSNLSDQWKFEYPVVEGIGSEYSLDDVKEWLRKKEWSNDTMVRLFEESLVDGDTIATFYSSPPSFPKGPQGKWPDNTPRDINLNEFGMNRKKWNTFLEEWKEYIREKVFATIMNDQPYYQPITPLPDSTLTSIRKLITEFKSWEKPAMSYPMFLTQRTFDSSAYMPSMSIGVLEVHADVPHQTLYLERHFNPMRYTRNSLHVLGDISVGLKDQQSQWYTDYKLPAKFVEILSTKLSPPHDGSSSGGNPRRRKLSIKKYKGGWGTGEKREPASTAICSVPLSSMFADTGAKSKPSQAAASGTEASRKARETHPIQSIAPPCGIRKEDWDTLCTTKKFNLRFRFYGRHHITQDELLRAQKPREEELSEIKLAEQWCASRKDSIRRRSRRWPRFGIRWRRRGGVHVLELMRQGAIFPADDVVEQPPPI